MKHRFGEAVLSTSAPNGSWASINRLANEDERWLVAGREDQEHGDWTATRCVESVTTCVVGEQIVLAGRAARGVSEIAVVLDGGTHVVEPQSDGLWLMLIDGVGGATQLVVRALDPDGGVSDEALVELPTDREPRRRPMCWVPLRRLRGLSRGIAFYGRS